MFLTILAFKRPITYVWGMNTWDKRRAEYKDFKTYYYHLSSDGWKEGRLFHTKKQYAHGMTAMGLATLKSGIIIYDFSLMPNHFHIILKGNGRQCISAFDYLKKKINARLINDGYPALPKDYGFKLTPIDSKQQMGINILYVDRNAYEKNISVPGGHIWGTANLHFSALTGHIDGIAAKELSCRERARITGSRMDIPPTWIFNQELGLLPSSFVDQSMFLDLFPSPKTYLTRLVKDYESFAKLGNKLEESVEFSEEEVDDIANTLAESLYPGRKIRKLTQEEKCHLCPLLNKNYNLSSFQIARTLSMPEYIVRQVLNSKDYGVGVGPTKPIH